MSNEEKVVGQMCGDNRFELINKYKQRLIKATNIETAKNEMKVIDNILFRFWQMGWLEMLDNQRKAYDDYQAAMDRKEKEKHDLAVLLNATRDTMKTLQYTIKLLKNLGYTQRELILEYQKQLNIETIVDFYD